MNKQLYGIQVNGLGVGCLLFCKCWWFVKRRSRPFSWKGQDSICWFKNFILHFCLVGKPQCLNLICSFLYNNNKKTAKTTTTTSIEQWKNECLIIFFKKINTKFIFMMNYLIRITGSMSQPRWQSWQHVRFTIKS